MRMEMKAAVEAETKATAMAKADGRDGVGGDEGDGEGGVGGAGGTDIGNIGGGNRGAEAVDDVL